MALISGFVGSHLCSALAKEYDVFALDVAEPSYHKDIFENLICVAKDDIEDFF